MKALLLPLLVLICTCRVFAAPPPLDLEKYRNMTTEQALEWAKGDPSSIEKGDFSRAAYALQRVDLVIICYHYGIGSRILEGIYNLPDSAFKREILVRILTDIPQDGWADDPAVNIRLNPSAALTAMAFMKILQPYIPELPETDELTKTPELRKALVERLEKAFAAHPIVANEKQANSPANPQVAKASTTDYQSMPDVSAEGGAAPKVTSSPATTVPSLIPWIIGGGLAALLLFVAARRALRL